MKLSIGISPCPNDTFIFDALLHNKIETKDFEFELHLADVETLNQWALEGKLDITKLSFPAFFQSLQHYRLLLSGAALGKAVGPLLISKNKISLHQVNECSIAVPGLNTTAHFLLNFAFPNIQKKEFIVFSEIEDAVLTNKFDCGVIIHENRFTYQEKGLHKIIDLGEYWEEKTQLPIPLGAIAIKNNVGFEIKQEINQLILSSIEFATKNYPTLPSFVLDNAQEMDETIMKQHINLYVNNYSLLLNDEAKLAIYTMLKYYQKTPAVKHSNIEDIF